MHTQLSETLNLYAGRFLWSSEGRTLAQTGRQEFDALRAIYEQLDTIDGRGLDRLDHALLVRHQAEMETEPEVTKRLLSDSRRLAAGIAWPAPLAPHAQIGIRLLKGGPLTDEEKQQLVTLRREWPRSWHIMYLSRLANLNVDNVSPPARDLTASAQRDQWWLERLQYLTTAIGLVYLIWIVAGGLPTFSGKPKAAVVLPRLWRPERVTWCVLVTFFLFLVSSNLLGLGIVEDSFYGQLICASVGSAALFVCFPLVWLFHSFVRKRRWYWDAIQLRWGDFGRVSLILHSLGVACTLIAIESVVALGLAQFGLYSDLIDHLSRSFWAWGAWSFVLNLFWGVIVAPLGEEVIYRGFLFSSFRPRFGPVWGAVASSSIFALTHGYSAWGFASVWIIGLALCWLFHRTGKLALTMMTHAFLNLLISPFDWLWMRI